jgi:hypothetical protein
MLDAMSSAAAPGPALSTSDSIPYAQTILALELSQLALVQRAVELLFRTAHSEAYQQLVRAGADATALHRPGSFGVFMGYDFHLTGAGPRLIEVNTNAGGALLNGLHTAAYCKPEQLDWLCCDPPRVDDVEAFIAGSFRAELEAARGTGAELSRLAIASSSSSVSSSRGTASRPTSATRTSSRARPTAASSSTANGSTWSTCATPTSAWRARVRAPCARPGWPTAWW